MTRAVFILALLLVGSGCSDSDDAAPAGSASATAPVASVPPPAPPTSASPYRDGDLPVAPDYEVEAEKSINAKNYRDKLAEIEGELGMPAASASASASAAAEPPPPPAEPDEAD